MYEEGKKTRWVCVVAVSSWQFEKLRKQTQEELRNTLDQLLEAEVGVSVDHSLQTLSHEGSGWVSVFSGHS